MGRLVLLLALAASPLAHGADVVKGAQLYRMHCAQSHGMTGVSVLPDTALLASLRTGKGAMPAFFGILNDRDILDVIAYARTLR